MNEDLADKSFNDVIKECLELREKRKKIYGNSWFYQDFAVESNFWGGVINKTNRLKFTFNKRFEENGYEKFDDNLRDLIILSIFTLVCREKERNNLKEQKRLNDYESRNTSIK